MAQLEAMRFNIIISFTVFSSLLKTATASRDEAIDSRFKAEESEKKAFRHRDEANAKRLKDKVLSWGKKSVIRKFDRGDQIFYRVQVRAGKTLSAAAHVEKVMNNAGYPGAFVVAR